VAVLMPSPIMFAHHIRTKRHVLGARLSDEFTEGSVKLPLLTLHDLLGGSAYLQSL
jgi:hypothetical protein